MTIGKKSVTIAAIAALFIFVNMPLTSAAVMIP